MPTDDHHLVGLAAPANLPDHVVEDHWSFPEGVLDVELHSDRLIAIEHLLQLLCVVRPHGDLRNPRQRRRTQLGDLVATEHPDAVGRLIEGWHGNRCGVGGFKQGYVPGSHRCR